MWAPGLLDCLLIFAGGACAGGINTIVGSGTLITFPLLVAVGLPPVAANIANSVGLAPGGVVGAWHYRNELPKDRRGTIALGIASSIGAVIGAVLLLELPQSLFKAAIPILILGAVALVLLGPWISARVATRDRSAPSDKKWLLRGCTVLTGVYGGYFGAAQGVILMGIFGLFRLGTLQRQNAVKNVLQALVNCVAALLFIATTHITWEAAGLIAAGAVLGGVVGAKIGRRLPPSVLRGLIVLVGVAAAVKELV